MDTCKKYLRNHGIINVLINDTNGGGVNGVKAQCHSQKSERKKERLW